MPWWGDSLHRSFSAFAESCSARTMHVCTVRIHRSGVLQCRTPVGIHRLRAAGWTYPTRELSGQPDAIEVTNMSAAWIWFEDGQAANVPHRHRHQLGRCSFMEYRWQQVSAPRNGAHNHLDIIQPRWRPTAPRNRLESWKTPVMSVRPSSCAATSKNQPAHVARTSTTGAHTAQPVAPVDHTPYDGSPVGTRTKSRAKLRVEAAATIFRNISGRPIPILPFMSTTTRASRSTWRESLGQLTLRSPSTMAASPTHIRSAITRIISLSIFCRRRVVPWTRGRIGTPRTPTAPGLLYRLWSSLKRASGRAARLPLTAPAVWRRPKRANVCWPSSSVHVRSRRK